jgi:uncharacterized protein YndB with AHSA1/START domain
MPALLKSIRHNAIAAALVLLGTLPAQAETSNVSPAGFTVMLTQDIKASPHQVFTALGQIGNWWNSDHTWSRKASNLSLTMEAGGCLCERWEGNGVMHGQVIMFNQDNLLRLQTSLGPLQSLAVNGVLTFQEQAKDGGTALKLTYKVVGNNDSGLDKLAPAVEGVLSEQMKRLRLYVETGLPEAPLSNH